MPEAKGDKVIRAHPADRSIVVDDARLGGFMAAVRGSDHDAREISNAFKLIFRGNVRNDACQRRHPRGVDSAVPRQGSRVRYQVDPHARPFARRPHAKQNLPAKLKAGRRDHPD
jgi:hypothetical protein